MKTLTDITQPNPVELREPDLSNLDSPFTGRDLRLYVAITNKCNRSCPFCSMYSSKTGKTFITLEKISKHIPPRGTYQVQLEGGEPLIHPEFFAFLEFFAAQPRCTRILVATNGSLFPFEEKGGILNIPGSRKRLIRFLEKVPARTTFKVSLNHALLSEDPLLFEKARFLLDIAKVMEVPIIFNLRKRVARECEFDNHLEEAVRKWHLDDHTNSFFLQRYGRYSMNSLAEVPHLVGTNFTLINPDGTSFGTDLITRSESMWRLP
ncbi:MAG: radical SAM protein [Promethearchaeota archaeon]